jgi:integrase
MGLWFDKRYKTYRYVWRDSAGKQHCRSLGKSAKDAKLVAAEYDRRKRLGDLAPLVIRAAISDHMDWFIKYHLSKKRAATRRSYSYALRRILMFFDQEGITHLDQVTRIAWEKFEYQILNEDRLSAETRNDFYAAISVFMNLAVQNNLIVKNPLTGVKRKIKNPRQRVKPRYTDEQIRKLRAAARPWFVKYIDLILLTGLRREEIWALEWIDIDYESKKLAVQSKPELDYIHKDYELRRVDLSEQALKLLQSIPHKRRDKFVFDKGDGTPFVGVDAISHNFTMARNKAGIPEGDLHSLRRTYATRLERAGATTSYLKNQLGHESLSTTEKYLHPDGEYLLEAGLNLRYEPLDDEIA